MADSGRNWVDFGYQVAVQAVGTLLAAVVAAGAAILAGVEVSDDVKRVVLAVVLTMGSVAVAIVLTDLLGRQFPGGPYWMRRVVVVGFAVCLAVVGELAGRFVFRR